MRCGGARGRGSHLLRRARRAARRGGQLAARSRRPVRRARRRPAARRRSRRSRPGCRRTESSAAGTQDSPRGVVPAPRPEPFGGPEGVAQIVLPSGHVLRRPGTQRADARRRTRPRDRARGSGEHLTDTTVNGTHLRVLTRGAGEQGGAIQLARPLDEVDRQLDRVLLVLLLVGAAGVALGAALGALVARTALSPDRRASPGAPRSCGRGRPDPSQRIDTERTDELGRLARSFNATLDALERSVEAQRQLVADASHELRTPIASLRANIQTLEHAERLPEAERESLRADIVDGAGRADRAGCGHRRAGARREAGRAGGRRAGGRDRRRGGRRARARAPDGVTIDVATEPTRRARRASAYPARDLEPRGQRAQVEPAGRHGRDRAGRRRPERARPRARVRRGATCRTCSSASTAPTARARCRARASASRSCARRPRRTAARCRPPTPRAAARCSGCRSARPSGHRLEPVPPLLDRRLIRRASSGSSRSSSLRAAPLRIITVIGVSR